VLIAGALLRIGSRLITGHPFAGDHLVGLDVVGGVAPEVAG
jgi:hypothetical protein